MKTKGQKQTIIVGTGAGSIFDRFNQSIQCMINCASGFDSSAAQVALNWSLRSGIWARQWDAGRGWYRVSDMTSARGAGSVPFLNDEQAAAVRSLVLRGLACCDMAMMAAGTVGDAGGEYDAAAAGAALSEARRLVGFASGLGVDLGNLGAGGFAGLSAAARPVAEIGAPCELARRSGRYESLCEAFGVRHGSRTIEARRVALSRQWLARHAAADWLRALPSWLSSDFIGPVFPWQYRAKQSGSAARLLARLSGAASGPSGGVLESLQSSLVGLPARARRFDALCSAFGAALPFGLARPAELVLTTAAGKAESAGKRWVRGGSARTAASKGEIGAGAGADDTGAHFVRLESEAVGIARGVWIDALAPRVADLESAGVRINRRIRRGLVGPVPVLRPVSRWLTSGRVTGSGVSKQGGKRARVCVHPVSSVMLGAAFGAGLSAEAHLWLGLACVLARPVVVVGDSNPALSKAARAACESWEYAAVKARDGREVGGGWAIQGAIHGLRDFSLSTPQGATSDETPIDDLGAAEWCAQVDAAAARIDGARTQDRVSSLVAEGYSEKLAALLVADEQAAAGAEQEQAAQDLGGVLRFAPDSGAGCGMPAWVAESVRQSCDAARVAMAERLSKARPQDKSKIAETDGAAVDMLAALESWIDGGPGLTDEQIKFWFPDDGNTSADWTKRDWERFRVLRNRGGIVKRDGPLSAVVVTQSRAAVCLSSMGRKSAYRPSCDGPPVPTDEQAAAIAALVAG